MIDELATETRGGLLRLHRRSPAASLRRWTHAGGALAASAAVWRRR
jgi:hypothetical protein